MKALINKNVLLGVSGGIAAYKSADLVRRLREAGAKVRVVMTASAKEFITPLTLQVLSGNPVYDNLFDPSLESGMGHIELARWADIVLVAPATADVIARLSQGHANDLLNTLCLATRSTIVLAPAMNQQMWQDSVTQENIAKLQNQNTQIIGPGFGEQACGEYGPGRMSEPQEIVDFIAGLFQTGSLAGCRLLLTAGPTQEAIDPIRFLSNHSSGKMGYALAQAAIEAGASVTLVSGPTQVDPPANARIIPVISGEDMYQAVMAEVKQCDIFIAVAAVADYRCETVSAQKINKNQDKVLALRLVKNPDILATVAALNYPPFTVGFSAQTERVIESAEEKLSQKQIDMIVANHVGKKGQGFNSDYNEATVIWRGGRKELPLMLKQSMARDIIQQIAERFHEKNSS